MIVGVHPLAGFDKVLHYRVPETLGAAVGVGSLVRVPIGNTLRLGIVGELGPPSDFPVDRLKSLAQVVYPFPALPRDLLALARWMGVWGISVSAAQGLDYFRVGPQAPPKRSVRRPFRAPNLGPLVTMVSDSSSHVTAALALTRRSVQGLLIARSAAPDPTTTQQARLAVSLGLLY